MPSTDFGKILEPPEARKPTKSNAAPLAAYSARRTNVAERDILDLSNRRTTPYFSWENRHGAQAPFNSQETLLYSGTEEKEMDNRDYLKDSKFTRIKMMQESIETNREDPQDKIKRKYVMSHPDSFSRNESIFSPYDPQNPIVQENTKKHADLLDMRQRLKNFFRFMHTFLFIGGVGLLVAGYFIYHIDTQMLGNLELRLYDMSKKLYFGSGGSLIVIAVLGQIMVSIHRFKILTWLIYLLLLFIGCCLTGTCMFTSLRSYKNHQVAKEKLIDLMNAYDGKKDPATKKWDILHQGYECCGVDSFTDWTDSPFGRTSLRTPMSCCRNATFKKDEFCGQNLLPNTEYKVANEIIFADGCITAMLKKSDIWYLSSGLHAGFLTFFVLIHWAFCLFLISSHRL